VPRKRVGEDLRPSRQVEVDVGGMERGPVEGDRPPKVRIASDCVLRGEQ